TFGINYPISPKLRYSYPRASASVLCNIAHALVAVPKFYTQVLHLMNKMNLPCPFGPLTAEPSMCREARAMSGVFGTGGEKEAPNEAGEEDALNPVLSSESETESELESDEEFKSLLNKKNLEPKRILKRKSKQMKRPRLETLKQSLLIESSSKPSKENAASVQEVFEVPSVNPKKKFNVHVQNTPGLGAGATTAQEVASEGFGKLYPQVKEGKTSQPKESSQFITQEELSKNRIPESEWPIIPVFKNYSPGTPSNRLYIKNLSKTATGFDLRHIFGKYLPPESDDEATKSNIRVMKEGRMKGQAFVTFPSTEAASLALKHTNGYILKDKPIVIVFGKVKAA
ncbi:UNVERIFIED_CONTAM: hypothetical protein GTU68_044052, partial [Idotea baltica]|nr:hypothetical protein [Idotea baltica]